MYIEEYVGRRMLQTKSPIRRGAGQAGGRSWMYYRKIRKEPEREGRIEIRRKGRGRSGVATPCGIIQKDKIEEVLFCQYQLSSRFPSCPLPAALCHRILTLLVVDSHSTTRLCDFVIFLPHYLPSCVHGSLIYLITMTSTPLLRFFLFPWRLLSFSISCIPFVSTQIIR